jgi:hypothetical protein
LHILSKLCWDFCPPSVCYLCLHQSSSSSYTLFKLGCDFFFLGILFGIIHFLLCTLVSSSAAEFSSSSVLFVESYLLFVCLLYLLDCREFLFFCGLKLPISSGFFFSLLWFFF